MSHDPNSGGVSDDRIRAILSRYAHLSDQQIALLPAADRLEMGRLLARSNYIAKADRTLTAEIATRTQPLPFTRTSRDTAIFRLVLITLAVLITCGFFGGIFL